MSTENITIPPETARHVLWHYGRAGGCQPGSFTQRLMEAFDTADIDNAGILASAYPQLGAAMLAAKLDEDGIDRLKAIASIRCMRCRNEDGPFADGGLCEACARPLPLAGAM